MCILVAGTLRLGSWSGPTARKERREDARSLIASGSGHAGSLRGWGRWCTGSSYHLGEGGWLSTETGWPLIEAPPPLNLLQRALQLPAPVRMGPGHAHLSVLALGPHLTLSLSPLPVDHHSQQLGPQPRPSLSPCPPPGLTLVGPSRPQALLPSPPWPQRGLVVRGERRVASGTLFAPSRTRNFEGGRQCSDPGTFK